MEKNKQTQHVGDNATSVQVGRDLVITNGVSYREAKDIALDVFKNNFCQLSGEAVNTATQRVEEFTEKLLKEMQSHHKSLLGSMKDPDMQYALYNAQKAYARTGDVNLSDVLVNILVKRAEIQERTMAQIVLNESLSVVPKLTNSQIDILSLVFELSYLKNLPRLIISFSSLELYIKENLLPFFNGKTISRSFLQHLEYTGCGKLEIAPYSIGKIFVDRYPFLFSKGFTKDKLDVCFNGFKSQGPIAIPCLHDNNLLQFTYPIYNELENWGSRVGAGEELIKKIKILQRTSLMSEIEVKEFLIDLVPEMAYLYDLWDNSKLYKLRLNNIGLAIGHANYCRKANFKFNINSWFN
jgi:hypothetical protein